jgi:hypothetical protein
VLPESLTSLSLAYWFDSPIAPGILPSQLKILTLGHFFNQPLVAGALPNSVEFGEEFKQTVEVETLPILGTGYALDRCSSQSFEILSMHHCEQQLDTVVLPLSLKTLKIFLSTVLYNSLCSND